MSRSIALTSLLCVVAALAMAYWSFAAMPEVEQRPASTATLATQHPPHALRGILQRALKPKVEGLMKKSARLVVGGDLKHGIHTGLDRSLTQQVHAQRVNRADPSDLEVREREVEPGSFGRGVAALDTRDLQGSAKTKLHFTGGHVGERDGHDAIELGRTGSNH